MWTFTKCFIQNKYDFHKSLDLFLNIKDTLKAFDDFKCKQKTVWSTAFWDVKVCIFWNCIQYIIYWDKTQTLKKFPSEKINGTKNAPFFLSRALTHHSFTFDLRFLHELKHKVRHSKTVCRIVHFWFIFLFIYYFYFIFNINIQ